MATNSALTNEELLDLARRGDEWAIREFFQYNQGLSRYVAGRFSQSYPYFDDLVGHANIGLVKAFNSFNSGLGSKFATYAVKVIENEVLMFLRREQRHYNTFSLEEPLSVNEDGDVQTRMEVEPDHQNIEEILENTEILREFDRFCSLLPKREREIAYRTLIEGENQKDVAKDYGISQSYVSRIVKHIKQQFKVYLETGRPPSSTRKRKVAK